MLADRPALVGAEPVPRVHLYENHSSSLIAWRRAGVRDRILVHLDGHADFDWLPDETVAHLAAAAPGELSGLELHPYSMDGSTHSRFAIWNFIYPAARLGVVRELIWVVPDGSMPDLESGRRLVRERLIHKLQMVSIEEAVAIRVEQGAIRGDLLGLPVTICELQKLPRLEEGVLLDIDLDYFTTRSALSQEVTERPWITPERLLQRLQDRGLRTDLATLSLSTIGGYLPPGARWLGRSLQRRLRSPGQAAGAVEEQRALALQAEERGDLDRAIRIYRRLAEGAPQDPTLWYALAEALEADGHAEDAEEAYERAASLDPLLRHRDLFHADRLWINGEFPAARARYRRYLDRFPDGPFTAYARRREAGCLMRTGDGREALEAWREVIQLAPEHGDTRLDYGVLLREAGAMGEALEQLRAARGILPDRVTYALALGTTYLRNGMVEEGVRELQWAVRRQPCLARAHGNLSAAMVQLGRFEEAARHLAVALAFQPQNPQLLTMRNQLTRRGIRVTEVANK